MPVNLEESKQSIRQRHTRILFYSIQQQKQQRKQQQKVKAKNDEYLL